MPLLAGKKNIGRNIETEQTSGKPHDQAVAIALDVARRKRAEGGSTVHKFHSGPIHSSVAGGLTICPSRSSQELRSTS